MFILINVLVLFSCTFHFSGMPVDPLPGDFNLTKGTRWVYSYSEYEPLPSDPTQTVAALFQLTQSVVDISRANGLIFVHEQSELEPIQVPTGLPAGYMPVPPFGDFWYIIKGRQVFESGAPVDFATINTDTISLAFDFPLSVNKSWCPVRIDLKDPSHKLITNCDYGGKLIIVQQSAYQVPAGRFKDCYLINQYYNDGSTFQWFCKGIGVVETNYDHNGTLFGFKQVLSSYSKGSQ